MRFHRNLKSITHSFIAKLIGIIILLAVVVILTVYTYVELLRANIYLHSFFALSVVIILIFSFGIYFTHRLLLPIRELAKGVDEISQGNLDIQLDIKSSDEIGELAKAFNLMTKNLRQMIRAREQLLLDVSHELRTPLTRSLLALEMADETEYTTTVKKNLHEVELMIKELLESHRLMSGYNKINISKIRIKDLFDKIVKEYSDEILRIKMNPISENLYFEADEELIKIVLRNLIENALKYSSENSRAVELSVIDKDDSVIVQIEDFGPGLDQDEIEKVFEPFYRTDKSRSRRTGGYGLGLHLCKKIMESHEGEIKIYNKEKSDGLIVELICNKHLQ